MLKETNLISSFSKCFIQTLNKLENFKDLIAALGREEEALFGELNEL